MKFWFYVWLYPWLDDDMAWKLTNWVSTYESCHGRCCRYRCADNSDYSIISCIHVLCANVTTIPHEILDMPFWRLWKWYLLQNCFNYHQKASDLFYNTGNAMEIELQCVIHRRNNRCTGMVDNLYLLVIFMNNNNHSHSVFGTYNLYRPMTIGMYHCYEMKIYIRDKYKFNLILVC